MTGITLVVADAERQLRYADVLAHGPLAVQMRAASFNGHDYRLGVVVLVCPLDQEANLGDGIKDAWQNTRQLEDAV